MTGVSMRQGLSVYVPAFAILGVIAVARLSLNVNVGDMTRDVAAIGKIHPLAGFLSSLGILLWCAAAAICYLAAASLRATGSSERASFLLSSAVLTTYLLFDDLFQFHEALAPRYLWLNEKIVYAALACAVVAYLLRYRHLLLATSYTGLLLAFGFLASSVLIDVVLEPWLWRLADWNYFVEDGLKWLGQVSWCAYFVSTSHVFLGGAIRH